MNLALVADRRDWLAVRQAEFEQSDFLLGAIGAAGATGLVAF